MISTRAKISFVYFRERTSDEGLLPHLRTLVVRAGALEAQGAILPDPGPLTGRLINLMEGGSRTDPVFIHRDADMPSGDARRAEIAAAAVQAGSQMPVVPVIPVRALEAWLLRSESEIRRVVGRPGGRTPLSLPGLHEVERRADPKGILRKALLDASETTGRRHLRELKAFNERRKVLLDRLDIDGPVRRLSAWRAMEEDIKQAIAGLMS
ncbi:hypothetical protein [Frankia tisae]|uniref:hypothetical protein n=1 Tax=Frankia tisae TaxID=2950104 RepID=UPI0021C0BD8E|nr:hypothetical protein [Frankia tisae]